MNVRIYSVHIDGYSTVDGWTGWDVVNVALTNDRHSAPEAMARGLELCKGQKDLPEPESLRVHEVRFIAEGQADIAA